MEGKVFVQVWKAVLLEYMREFNYNAEEAKLEFDLSLYGDNVSFEWFGFNDSMPNYINETIDRIIKMRSENLEKIFEQVKEKLSQSWKNFYLEQTYR